MDSQKTLIDIAQVAQKVSTALAGRRTVEGLQLDKIVVGARALLEALLKTSLLNDGRIDDRLTDWLVGDEPQVCLQTLKRMDAILNGKRAHRGGNFLGTSSFTHSQNISREAIRLFQIHEGYFHYLLMPMDVWNRETDNSRPNMPVQHNPPHVGVEEVIGNGNVTRLDTSRRVPQKREIGKQGIDAEKLENILGWLNAWNCDDIHRRTTNLRQPDTCAWLPKTNEFKTWRSTGNSFLWLHGKAGAGKSVLAASVIENLKESLEDEEILAFFYCDFRTERSTSAAEVIRSLLSQLLRQFSWNAVDLGELIDELVKQSDGGSSTVNDVIALANYMSRVVARFDQRPWVVIDALDECNDREELLEALTELSKSNLRLLVTSRPLQVIKDSFEALSSISMDTMKYEVTIDIKLHITRVMDSHRRLRIMDNILKEEIYSTLSQKADGMFRWVQCQLDVLKRCMTPARIYEALDDLPKDLDETYSRILLRIDKVEEEEVVRRALEWLVAALRPLELSMLMDALSIDLEHQVLDHTCGPIHGHALLDALGSLVTYDELTGVIILSHFSVKEYLTGEPIRTKFPTYYVNEQAADTQLALRCMCYIVAYLKLSRQSVSYRASSLGTRIHDDGYGVAVTRSTEHSGDSFRSPVSNPLLKYVLLDGFHHLFDVNPNNQAVLQAIVDLVSETQRNPLEWERLCDGHPSWPFHILKHDLVLYILICFAPEPMLRSYLDTAKPKLKDGTNPLIYAAHHDQVEHCRTLLSRGVSLNHRGEDLYLPRQVLPIEVALREPSSIDVVDLFLEAGSPVPQELFLEVLHTKISKYPSVSVARLLQTDEFVEWAISILDEELLLRAVNPGQYSRFPNVRESDIDVIQRRLVQLDCDTRTQFNEKSLYLAVSAGHVSTVKDILSSGIPLPHDIVLGALNGNFHPKQAMIRLLLGAGCNVHVTSTHTWNTPLHLVLASSRVSEADSLQCVRLLVGAGCDPSSCNLDGETPLHLATRGGHNSILEYLLSLHVQLPSDILLEVGLGPSVDASMIISLGSLTSRGASVHAVAADGNTLLHFLGLSGECLEYVKVLINAGCNPRLQNALGETALDVAVKLASLEVVQYLLSFGIPLSSSLLRSVCGSGFGEGSSMIRFLIRKGVDVHSTCENGDNLLHLSMRTYSEAECLERVEVLLNAGCDVHARNLAGETPLHVAARSGYISVIEYLFSLGLSAPLDELFITALLEGLTGQSHPKRTYQATIRFLIDKGTGVQIVGKDGKGLLHGAAAMRSEEDALEVVRLLVHSGCQPSALDSDQETPLHIAARQGHISVICYLLSLDPVLPPDVLLAASKGYRRGTGVIRYLVNNGARVSVTTTDGNTPLHLLLGQRDEIDCLEDTKILVDAGCDPRARNLAGETPLHTAARSGFVSVLKYFLSKSIPLPRDILSVARPVTARFLLEERVDVRQSISFNDDRELIHRILDFDIRYSEDDEDESADVECVRTLVGLGWDPSLYDSSGETPMHVATRRGRIFVVRYLLSQRVPLPSDILLAKAADADRSRLPSVRMTRLLIREGAGVNITAPNGDTPLHFALRYDFSSDTHFLRIVPWELVQTLLNNGADPTARNLDGQTPLRMAEEKGHFFKENFLRLVRNSGHARTSN